MPQTLDRFRPSRPWLAIRGPKQHRTIVLKFRLERRARVVFTVIQLAPVCRTIGSFSVTGHRGSNRVRFNGRMGHHRLQPGTYRIKARTLHSQMVRELVVVLVGSGRPSPAALASARHRDVCSLATNDSIGNGNLAANIMNSGGSSAMGDTEGAEVVHSAPESTKLGRFPHPSALGPTHFSNNVTSPLALALFGLAILLLGLATLPADAVPDPRLNQALVLHRAEVTIAGLAALAAAIAVLLTS
jgi:hypothetical protein